MKNERLFVDYEKSQIYTKSYEKSKILYKILKNQKFYMKSYEKYNLPNRILSFKCFNIRNTKFKAFFLHLKYDIHKLRLSIFFSKFVGW